MFPEQRFSFNKDGGSENMGAPVRALLVDTVVTVEYPVWNKV